jgi:hypothetical protein
VVDDARARRAPEARRTDHVRALVIALLLLAFPTAALADDAQTLAERYSPVVRLVAQKEPCGHGEAYEPTDVDTVLGNHDVALRGPWDNSIVKIAPTGADLGEGLFGYHLDFPGHALSPGCDYDKWSHLIAAAGQPTTYAHVLAEKGRLALQYWFFYVFNDFNDKHEGDWEMIQLDFDAPNATAALSTKPEAVGYSQHQGAERADWGDPKLTIVDGTHPVVYPALGSHANYYGENLYLGRSAAEGVGCDDTNGPSRQVIPVVKVVPPKYAKTYPWLDYAGHWGEQHSGFYNGPTGPNTKLQWTQPITWADTEWRDAAYAVPVADTGGPTATNFFCGAVAAGSNILTRVTNNPWPVVITLALLAALLLWLASRTRWEPNDPLPVRGARSWGQIVNAARVFYGGHLELIVRLGVLFLILGVATSIIQFGIYHLTGLSALLDVAGESNAFVAGGAMLVGIVITALGLILTQTASALVLASYDDERQLRPLDAYRIALRRWRSLLAAFAFAVVVIGLLTLTGFGVVFAAWFLVRWSMFPQVIAIENRPWRDALRRSSQLVRGDWWRVAMLTLFVTLLTLALGPLIGAVMLLVSTASFNLVNLVAAIIYVFTLPFVAIATTYLYFDLVVTESVSVSGRALMTPSTAITR